MAASEPGGAWPKPLDVGIRLRRLWESAVSAIR
jgi:hypothetical protein